MHMTTLVKIAKYKLKFDFSKKLTQMENVNFYWTLFFVVVIDLYICTYIMSPEIHKAHWISIFSYVQNIG